MAKTRILIVIVIVALLFMSIGCVKEWESEISELQSSIDRLESNNEQLVTRVQGLESEIHKLNEFVTLNAYHEDLTELSNYERVRFEEFRENYDDEALKRMSPISICKMYLYAGLIGDYETQYEFYASKEREEFWMKEEHLEIRDKDRHSAYDIFEDVYSLRINVKTEDKGSAKIKWNSRNGYVDEFQGPWTYTFRMVQEDDVWKVGFLPLQ